jgi:hypothetical protein
MLLSYQIGVAAPVAAAIQVPVGFYTPSQLAAVIQVLIRATTPLTTFEMAYGQDVGGQQYNIPAFFYAADNTSVNQIAFQPLPYNIANYPYPSTTKQLFDLLGFTNRNTELALGGSSNFTLCQAIRYVDIVCNQLTNSQAQKDQTSQTIARNMLCRLYVGSAPGVQSTIETLDDTFCPPGCAPTVLYSNYTSPKQIQWIPNQNIPGFLEFQVYDDAGDLLDYAINQPSTSPGDFSSSTSDWSMTMLVSEC